VSAAVPAAAASVLVTITPADAKPMRTGMRSNFGMYLTFMLLSVVDGREIDWIPLEESVREPYERLVDWTGVFAVA
jgi:hypothetical protein